MQPHGPVHEADGDRVGFLRVQSRVAAGGNRDAVAVVVLLRITHVRRAAGAIEAFRERRRAHVARDGAAQAELIVERGIETGLPRHDRAAARIIRPAHAAVEVELLQES